CAILSMTDYGGLVLDRKNVLRCAGGYVAWVIGSGFATGQEVMQFYSSFGLYSIGIIVINLFLFLIIGSHIMATGYINKLNKKFNQYEYFCGRFLGKVLKEIMPIIIFSIMVILVSGAGATLNEYYGVNHYVGAAIMTLLVLFAYLFGFENLVSVISKIGPIIIIFTILVGTVTIIKDHNMIDNVLDYLPLLEEKKPINSWWFSGILYGAYNLFCGSTYYSSLGASAKGIKEAKMGAVVGSVALILAIAVMNFAMLSNLEAVALLSIPTLYLANRIAVVFGGVFSVVLIAGIFSSSSPMMWIVCDRFVEEGTRSSKIFACTVAVLVFVCGMLPFDELVNKIYPYLGYMGIIYLICVAMDKIKSRV
ncbi:MAG TPA: hypothetical protein VJ916_02400, partial [Anaerovoracaceae bacterium]|nr:hypothetical protein [Anaerovoracaceae bacterium]